MVTWPGGHERPYISVAILVFDLLVRNEGENVVREIGRNRHMLCTGLGLPYIAF